MKATAYFDGGSRGNPGPAGCAVVLYVETDPDNPVELTRMVEGDASNNVAEYEGLLFALRTAVARGVTDIQVISDSKLVVEQVLGAWQVNDPRLRMMCAEARELATAFDHAEILHVRRAQNKRADELVTKMLDEHTGSKRK